MKQNLTGMENIMKTIIELMTDEFKKASYIALITLTKEILETCIDLLGIQCPDRM